MAVGEHLAALGQAVELVATLDSDPEPTPGLHAGEAAADWAAFVDYYVANAGLAADIAPFQPDGHPDVEAFLSRMKGSNLDALARLDSAAVVEMFAVFRRHVQAEFAYRPAPSALPIVNYLATRRVPETEAFRIALARYWTAAEVVPIDATHESIIAAPTLDQVVADLKSRLLALPAAGAARAAGRLS